MSRNFGLNNHLYEKRFADHKMKLWLHRLKVMFCIVMTFALAVTVMILFYALGFAGDDGRHANSPLKGWFDQLASEYGLCCSVADGRTIDDPDIDMNGQHCRESVCVRVDGNWLGVPEKAIVKSPNRYGRAVVWPMNNPADGTIYVRCFLPGAGA